MIARVRANPRAFAWLAIAAIVAGCGPSSDRAATTAPPPAAPAAAPASPAPLPASAAPAETLAQRGKAVFDAKCVLCHTIGEGDKVGPDLRGVTTYLDDAWLARWLRDPAPMLAADPHAKAQLAKFKVPMPDPELRDDEIAALIAWFRENDASIPSGGAPAGHAHDHGTPSAAAPAHSHDHGAQK